MELYIMQMYHRHTKAKLNDGVYTFAAKFDDNDDEYEVINIVNILRQQQRR